MKAFRAAWVCPIDQPPIKDGIIAVADGRIMAVGKPPITPTGLKDLGNVVVMPGLVMNIPPGALCCRDRVPTGRDSGWGEAAVSDRGRPKKEMPAEHLPPIRDAVSKEGLWHRQRSANHPLAAVETDAGSRLDGWCFTTLGYSGARGALVTARRTLRDSRARGERVSWRRMRITRRRRMFQASDRGQRNACRNERATSRVGGRGRVSRDGERQWRSMLDSGLWPTMGDPACDR